MAFQLGELLTGGGIPHPRRLVQAGRHHALPVGRKRRTPDNVGMAFQLRELPRNEFAIASRASVVAAMPNALIALSKASPRFPKATSVSAFAADSRDRAKIRS